MALVGVTACADSADAPDYRGNDTVAVRGLAAVASADAGGVDADAGNDETADVAADAALTCTAIAARAPAALPHVVIPGAEGKAVVRVLGELLSAQQPPLAEGTQTYTMAGLSCASIFTPSAQGSSCDLAVSIDGAAPVSVLTTVAPDLAERLLDALGDAGADACLDFAHGTFLRLSNVTIDVASGTIEFDDASRYALPPNPNVRAGGAAGRAVLDAMLGARIDDCDPSRSAFIVCNAFTGSPACSWTPFPLERVGDSELVNVCLPSLAAGPTVQLGAPEALALWNAILGAADVAGYTPLNGTLEQATIINAQQFTWDGESVGFLLTADNPRPPPRPAP